jgi:hypothetical protein
MGDPSTVNCTDLAASSKFVNNSMGRECTCTNSGEYYFYGNKRDDYEMERVQGGCKGEQLASVSLQPYCW